VRESSGGSAGVQGWVIRTIREQIETGVYRPGDRIPSVRECCRSLGVSATTVVRAYRALEAEGLIAAHPQSGFYVQASAVPPIPKRPIWGWDDGTEVRRSYDLAPRQPYPPSDKVLYWGEPALEHLPVAELLACVKRAALQHEELNLLAGDEAGLMALREQIAHKMLVSGCSVDPKSILITNGCAEALLIALRAIAEPGAMIAMESPRYFGFPMTADVLGMRVVEVPSSPRDGIDLDALEGELRSLPIAAVMVTPNFSNPTGSTMPLAARQRLVDLARRYDVRIAEDDTYGDLRHDRQIVPSCKSLDRDENVWYASSFSQTVCPGFRVGWLATAGDFFRANQIKYSMNGYTPPILQYALSDFLARHSFTRLCHRAARKYRQNVREMIAVIRESFPPGTEVEEPKGGYFVWPRLPSGIDTGLELLDLCQREEGFQFLPGGACSEHGWHVNCLRLAAATWSPEAADKVRRIGEIAKSLYD